MNSDFDGTAFSSPENLLDFLKQAYLVDTTTIRVFKAAPDATAAREAKFIRTITLLVRDDHFAPFAEGEARNTEHHCDWCEDAKKLIALKD